ncbi:hypothetical protein Mmc1_1159 [Magnetococcus marinus MC-1]|uniref:VOC domain-containing protein n=1 Tax=Magnetococcus marinus (strain ATCC BAA-1437 / JCM 17883 / MC-1) TaxID=156889 RepID=A0L6S7_MAGMM|nr:glyoxalase/bleomycin resistance/dioxygenase family protein [Magnetococcus marinus]ABK43670.1 hypothetical protein Mmc1_1159 [Magnetococcus marinus MC-1]
MILGADHISMNGGQAEDVAPALEQQGWSVAFRCQDTLPVAATWTRTQNGLFDLHFARYTASGPALEHTGYTPASQAATAHKQGYLPLFGHIPPLWQALPRQPEARLSTALQQALGGTPQLGLWAPFQHPLWVLPQGEAAGVLAVALTTPERQREQHFWQTGLGFRLEQSGDGWSLLQKAPPIPAWRVRLLLVDGPTRGGGFLDDHGFPCLALLSNRLSADLQTAEKHGGTGASPIITLSVNQQRVNVAFLRSPAGYPVELIEAQK